MFSTLKVTDGDLLILNLESNESIPNYAIAPMRDRIQSWLDKRGLQNVEVLIGTGNVKLTVGKLSVNDVFEDKVLKGENNE